MTKLQTAFIGLGVMGSPMAGHLVKQGHKVTVYNRTESKSAAWTNTHTGQSASTPKDASLNANVIFMCVGNDDDVRSVVYGESGILAGLHENDILVDHTTTSAHLALELAKACKEVGAHFIDAPVSGGQAGAENGKLTVMCGGDSATFEIVEPIMQAYAQQIQRLGGHGQGQRCKMVNQICIAGILQGLSEALILAETAGLSVPQVVNTLQHGAAGSWQMVNRLETMAKDEFNFGFAIDWMRKDLGICLEEAKNHNVTLPLTADVDQKYKTLQEQGMGRMDTSALVRAVKRSL